MLMEVIEGAWQRHSDDRWNIKAVGRMPTLSLQYLLTQFAWSNPEKTGAETPDEHSFGPPHPDERPLRLHAMIHSLFKMDDEMSSSTV